MNGKNKNKMNTNPQKQREKLKDKYLSMIVQYWNKEKKVHHRVNREFSSLHTLDRHLLYSYEKSLDP